MTGNSFSAGGENKRVGAKEILWKCFQLFLRRFVKFLLFIKNSIVNIGK